MFLYRDCKDKTSMFSKEPFLETMMPTIQAISMG